MYFSLFLISLPILLCFCFCFLVCFVLFCFCFCFVLFLFFSFVSDFSKIRMSFRASASKFVLKHFGLKVLIFFLLAYDLATLFEDQVCDLYSFVFVYLFVCLFVCFSSISTFFDTVNEIPSI